MLASVPSCLEDLSSPMVEASLGQAGAVSGPGLKPLPCSPASPKRKLEATEEAPGEEHSKRARVMVAVAARLPGSELAGKDV